MAKIIPEQALLPESPEGTLLSRTFTATLEPGEALTEIKIISHNFPNGTTVQGATYTGYFKNIFNLGQGALKYRVGDNFFEASSFSELPPKGTALLYSYRAPSSVETSFKCTVELSYTKIESGPGGEPGTGPGVDMKMTKEYTQPIYGDYGNFARQLRDYVRD